MTLGEESHANSRKVFSVFTPKLWHQKSLFRTRHNKSSCINALVSVNPVTSKDVIADILATCKDSTWTRQVHILFVIYRVCVFFWILFGLTFTGSLITIFCREINILLL